MSTMKYALIWGTRGPWAPRYVDADSAQVVMDVWISDTSEKR